MARRGRDTKTPTILPETTRQDGSSRNTFRVARANRLLAETLPNVVLSKRPERSRLDLTPLGVPDAAQGGQRVAKRTGKLPERDKPKSLTLDKVATCHERPSDTRGNGTGRKFAGRYCNR